MIITKIINSNFKNKQKKKLREEWILLYSSLQNIIYWNNIINLLDFFYCFFFILISFFNIIFIKDLN
jgi:hypothetical protein